MHKTLKNMTARLALSSVLGLAAASVLAADQEPRPEMADGTAYQPSEPKARGAEYKLTSGSHNHRTMWGWRIVRPDGTGLAFGGIASWTTQEINGQLQRSDDPCVRTQVRRDGKWVYIHEDLRKKNALQPLHTGILNLREPLKRITAKARHIFFEGREEAAEKASLEKEVAPQIAEFLGKFKVLRAELARAGAGDPYASGQAARALAHFDRVPRMLEGLGTRTSHDSLLSLRQARVNLEQAAEFLDAEPPARALSMLAFDQKSGLFALFGGDHLDYLMNDLWVFDPRAERWMQRHPKLAPEPRGDHVLKSDGQGRLILRGGYLYNTAPRPQGWASSPYVHTGTEEWTYDLATDAWSGSSAASLETAGARHYRNGGHLPEYFTADPRPDAVAHEKILAALPANTWVDLKPPLKFAGNRDWGTLGYDAERDMIYFYNGGHSAYAGTDVAHYHLATNRWDQLVEVEYPLNYIGASGSSAPGWSFNRRPWVTNHLWNSYRYHPGMKRLIVAGRYTSSCFPKGMGNPDVNLYLYDPEIGDWEKRAPSNVEMSCMGAQLLYVPGFGMIEWDRWLLDDQKLEWKKLEPKGKLPGSGIDFSGFVNDPKRNRVLYFSGGTYQGTPYSGEVFAMAVPSLEVTSFKPEGAEHFKALYAGRENSLGTWILREVIYHPGADMFIFSSNLPGGYTAALDIAKNRWVGLKLPGPHPWGLSSAMAYDAKRDLIYSVGTRAEVSALRLDLKTLEIKTMAEIAAEAPKHLPPAKQK